MKEIKKITAIVLICFSAIFIIMCGISIGMGVNNNEVSRISYEEANYKNSNEALLENVKKVQEEAIAYRNEGNDTYSVAELVSHYFRHERYYEGIWATYVPLDSAFVQRVENSGKSINVTLAGESAKLYDLRTGKDIDFIHMLATTELYITCQNNMACRMAGIADFGGWAGDLAELAIQVGDYKATGASDEEAALYSDSMLGTNKDGSRFNSADMLADLDAFVLFSASAENNIKEDIYTALINYYVNLSGTYISDNRVDSAKHFMTGTPKDLATAALSKTYVLNVIFEASELAKMTAEAKAIVSNSFEKYMNKIPYIELNTTSSTQMVGETKVVEIIESNLVEEVIEVEPNIAYVTKSGYEYSITPFKAGTATIKISSKDMSVSSTMQLTAKNVAPSIKTNLLDSYDLVTKNNKEISFEVEGTNNVYTWYISDKIDGEYKVLTTTTEPKYNIDPKIDLNGKYIKCGIKNDGNAEVFTKATKLNVTENPIVDTGDLTIPIMLTIIILIILANVIYQRYVKTKPITNLIVK